MTEEDEAGFNIDNLFYGIDQTSGDRCGKSETCTAECRAEEPWSSMSSACFEDVHSDAHSKPLSWPVTIAIVFLLTSAVTAIWGIWLVCMHLPRQRESIASAYERVVQEEAAY